MSTFTKETNAMVQQEDLNRAVKALEQEGIIVHPTDTVWSIGCHALDRTAVARMLNLKRANGLENFEVLVNSLEMLKDYIPFIHPRLETLLSYHLRPLTVIFDHASGLPAELFLPDGSVAIRLIHDRFCKVLIDDIGAPLLSSPATFQPGHIPTTFGAVSSAVLEKADYVVKHRQMEKEPGELSVMVRLSEREELIFLRE